MQGQEEGDGVGQVRAARPHLSELEKPQVPSNKASRFSRVYPAGPLFLPRAHLLGDYATPTSKKKKKELKELIIKDKDIKAFTPEGKGLPGPWWPLQQEGSKG